MEVYKAQVTTVKDILFLRTKLYDASIRMEVDPIASNKIVSETSDILKILVKEAKIGISISIQENASAYQILQLTISGALPSDYDKIISNHAVGRIKMVKDAIVARFICRLNIDKWSEAEMVLNVKSAEELMMDIQSKNSELQTSFSNLKSQKDLNARMKSELEVGQNIQLSMLPENQYKSRLFDLYADIEPAREVGGDFYDFFLIDEDHLCITIGDVSGKGVPAALMMAVCKTLIKSNSRNVHSSGKILTWVNNEMAENNPNHMFVTVFLGILNLNTGIFTYTNAGHNPTYIKRSDGSVDKLSELHGVVIAAMEGLTYTESTSQIKEGDLIFAYTDGIPEAHNTKGDMFGDDQLLNYLRDSTIESSKKLVKQIFKKVREFEDGADKFDDVTALSVHFLGSKSGIS